MNFIPKTGGFPFNPSLQGSKGSKQGTIHDPEQKCQVGKFIHLPKPPEKGGTSLQKF